jgi:SAM-dependent methyltransferase
MTSLTITTWLTIGLVSLFMSWIFYFLFNRYYFRPKEFRTWLKRPRIKSTLPCLKKLYQDVNTLEVAHHAWQQPQFRDYAFIYGEIDIISFIATLEVAQPKSGEIFYDLGSGAGKAVFTAALAFEFKACKGIELVPALFRLSCQLQQQLPTLRTYVEFIQADFLTIDFSDADIVFINAACFLGETWQAILHKLMQLKPGTRVILGAKQLPPTYFRLLEANLRYMSWGIAKVSIYQRENDLFSLAHA